MCENFKEKRFLHNLESDFLSRYVIKEINVFFASLNKLFFYKDPERNIIFVTSTRYD